MEATIRKPTVQGIREAVVVEVPVVGPHHMEVVLCSPVDECIRKVVVESMFEAEGPMEAPVVEVESMDGVVKEAEPIEAMAGATKVEVMGAVVHPKLTIKPALQSQAKNGTTDMRTTSLFSVETVAVLDWQEGPQNGR
jgi:hypothetical protein